MSSVHHDVRMLSQSRAIDIGGPHRVNSVAAHLLRSDQNAASIQIRTRVDAKRARRSFSSSDVLIR